MTERVQRETAKIYQFPAGGRARRATDSESRRAADVAAARHPRVDFGSGWYHDAAIRGRAHPRSARAAWSRELGSVKLRRSTSRAAWTASRARSGRGASCRRHRVPATTRRLRPLPGAIGENAAADAALARQADAIGEFARSIVVAAGQHDRVDAARALRHHDRQARRRVAAELGEKAPGHRQLPTRHGDGAVMEIDAEGEFDGVFDDAERFHVVGKRDSCESRCAARRPPPPRRSRSRDRRPRKRMNLRISPNASRGLCPDRMMSVTAIAPALMKGLRGLPRSNSSWTMELKGLPDGSRPTRRHKLIADLAQRKRQREHLGDALDRERRRRNRRRRDVAVRIDRPPGRTIWHRRAASSGM